MDSVERCLLCYVIVMIYYLVFLAFFFFFQAEDGIRDRDVTGVQTCALPISTIVELNGDAWRIGREGAIAVEEIERAMKEIGRASCREKCRSRGSADD